MIIKNGKVFCNDNTFKYKNIRIENNIITEITEENIFDDSEVIDATDKIVIPGLVDIHSHGAVSFDCSDANIDGLLSILQYEKKHGVTSYCPTTMTLPDEQIQSALSSICAAKEQSNAIHARIVGINLEGPFLDVCKKGAHDEKYIKAPNKELFQKYYDISDGLIKLVTLAPNQENASHFISTFNSTVNISLGHTAADYQTSLVAFHHGANHVTHLYNAMSPLSHREPGLIGAAFDCPNVVVELICDRIHINDTIIKMTFNLFKNRVALISDSMRATGLSDGVYDLGGQVVRVNGKLATLEDGTIAGSVTNLFDCMKNVIDLGISPEEVIPSVTSIPAKSIGLDNVGVIAKGAYADLLLLDNDYNLIKVI